MSRGIILPSLQLRVDREKDALVATKAPYSNNDMLYFLLYWDRMAKPISGGSGELPLEKELLSNDCLEIVKKDFSDDLNESLMRAPFEIANELSNDIKTDWVLNQIHDDFFIKKNNSFHQVDTLRFNLYKCLPVPIEGVRIEDVLNFKVKRKDEFTKLHALIDELYTEICKHPDGKLATYMEVTKLNNSISEIQRVARETWMDNIKSYSLCFDYKKFFNGLKTGIVEYGDKMPDIETGNGLPEIPGHAIAGTIGAITSMIVKTKSDNGDLSEKGLSYIYKGVKSKIV